jgi:prolipoprotein diacylglyceryltransferase
MAFPVSLPFGPWRLHPHLLFETLAYLIGFRTFLILRRRQGDVLAEETRFALVAAAAVGAALGSKLLHWLQQPSLWSTHATDLAFLLGGKSIVGGLLGGWLAVEWAKLRLGEKRSSGDLFVLPLCLGMAIGRVGCFLTGLDDHTHGSATALPWGFDFGDGVRRHPTQLYEIAVLALIALWAARARAHRPRSGDLFRGFMLLYLGFRFVIEFIKPGAREYLGLSGIQVACLATLAMYARDLPRLFGRAPEPGNAAPGAWRAAPDQAGTGDLRT